MITVGIDEVGRGPWAGPLVAGAVILGHRIEGLKDSKKLSALQRTRLALEIESSGAAIGLGWVSPQEIDRIGITCAVQLAMTRALEQITIAYDEVIIDGNINYFSENPKARALIKADDTVQAVSAASIVAKVARDTYMHHEALQYPGYGFESHVGYGTKQHSDALRRLGVSPMHRRSYKPVKELLA